jgi:iron only hydrogenase large subunit-like protein
MFASGYHDVDISLTSREITRMNRPAGIDSAGLPEEELDTPLDNTVAPRRSQPTRATELSKNGGPPVS